MAEAEATIPYPSKAATKLTEEPSGVASMPEREEASAAKRSKIYNNHRLTIRDLEDVAKEQKDLLKEKDLDQRIANTDGLLASFYKARQDNLTAGANTNWTELFGRIYKAITHKAVMWWVTFFREDNDGQWSSSCMTGEWVSRDLSSKQLLALRKQVAGDQLPLSDNLIILETDLSKVPLSTGTAHIKQLAVLNNAIFKYAIFQTELALTLFLPNLPLEAAKAMHLAAWARCQDIDHQSSESLSQLIGTPA